MTDLLDEIFQRIYRFNNIVPRENYNQAFSEMKEVAVISIEVKESSAGGCDHQKIRS